MNGPTNSFLLLLAASLMIRCDAPSTERQKQEQKPNIIFILADDLGWGDVGFNGQQLIQTPNIDQLAREGMVFNRMYAGSTVCGPSRASLLTGLHTGHGEVRGNPRWSANGSPVDFDPSHNTLGEILKKANYRTGAIGKWGLAENLNGTEPNKQGFDYFYGFNRHRPAHHYYPELIWENDSIVALPQNNTKEKLGDHVQELFTQKALSFITEEADNPFFLYLAYTTPHYELTIPEAWKSSYTELDWPLREMVPGHYLHDKNGHVTYAAMVSKMDHDIGRLVHRLKETDQYKNTLIIFTSDNGHEYDDLKDEFFNSNGPFRGRKRDLFDGGTHVPFVASWPAKIPANQTSDRLGAFWDVKATLADLTSVSLNEATDGESFLPSLLGEGQPPRETPLYWEFNESKGPMQALLLGKWKLIHQVESGDYGLYNLEADPQEMENVIEDHEAVFKDLRRALVSARTPHAQFPLTRRSVKRR